MSKQNSGVKAEVGVSVITKSMVIAGFGVALVCNIPFGEYDNIAWISIAKKFLEGVGMTLFSAGLVSVVVEISTISEIVKKALKGILSEKFPYEKLAISRLDEINKQLALHRLDSDILKESDVIDSPYSLEPELLALSKGLYYEYHKAKFVITPDDEKGVFHKRVEFDYKIINKNGVDNSAKFVLTLICQKDDLTIQEVESVFSIKSFKIEECDKIKASGKKVNTKDLTSVADNYWKIADVEPQAHSLYKYEIHFEYPLEKKLVNRVRLVYEYEIPQNDIVQSYKLNYPSKNLEHEISISGTNWEVTGDAYTAFYFPDVYDNDYNVVQSVATAIRVDFRDWAVPGAGYMVTFLKK